MERGGLMNENQFVHPYIPNSEPDVLKSMLKALGLESVEDIYKEIPDRLRYKGRMNIPDAIHSEFKLRKHVEGLLAENKSCKEYISFLGGGTWQHDVPAVCDTIMSRDEFLTSYVGDAYSDHGKFQSLFESSSMIGDLTGFEACNTPTYDWANAIAIACRMACRTLGRKEILFAKNSGPNRKLVTKNYCKPEIEVKEIGFNLKNGLMDLDHLKSQISQKTAAIYFENPSYLGSIETQVKEICAIAKEYGALVIVGVDPTSLGILEGPASYGADYAVGDLQPLGMHMSFGGGLGGFIATHDKKEFLGEYPSLLFGICETEQEGEYGFGEVFYERTSYASREKGKDFIGTCAAMHGIVAGVYMAIMGPQGFKELGEGILQRVSFMKERLKEIRGVKIPLDSFSYSDFTVNFDGTGKSVTEINKALLEYKIFGGINLSKEFPELGQSALFSITEVHGKEDLDKLFNALKVICA